MGRSYLQLICNVAADTMLLVDVQNYEVIVHVQIKYVRLSNGIANTEHGLERSEHRS